VLQLRIFDGDTWTGLISVCQVLEKTPSMTDCLSEGHYTLLILQHLLIDNNHENLHTLLQLTTAIQLFIMSCDNNELLNVETKQVFESLCNFTKKNQSVKIILNTQSENVTLSLLQDVCKEALSNAIVTRDEQLT